MYYIGVDIGGTNLVAGLVSEDNHILATAKRKSGDYKTAEGMIRAVAELSVEAMEKAGVPIDEVAHVGVGIPGAVDRKTKFVYLTLNAPFKDTPFEEVFHRYLDIPVYLENDANCAVMAEFLAGSARGAKSALMVTLGTGVGGGYINYGHLEGGINLMGMEVGHMVIRADGLKCACGRRGCWEQYSSATALKRISSAAVEAHPDSLMAAMAAEQGKVSGRLPFEAKRAGCPVGAEVCETYLNDLSVGVANLINMFQPEVLVIGGGVSHEKEEDFLLPLREKSFALHEILPGMVHTKIICASLGNDAGVIGASLLGRVNLIDR